MAANNAEIAKILMQLADMLDIQGANPFRIRAYRNAARSILSLNESISDMIANGEDITKIHGVGTAIARKIHIIVNTGELPFLKYVEKRTPKVLSELMRIEGLGPKRVKRLYEELKIKNITDLKKALKTKKIQSLKRFGPKLVERIRTSLTHYDEYQKYIRFTFAMMFAKSLLNYIKTIPGIKRVELAGSLRRRKDVVKDIDILVTGSTKANIIDQFVKHEDIVEILAQGPTRATVRLKSGFHVDLRLVPQASYGAALLYFTGSKPHNIAIRGIGLKKGYKINEYGIYKNNKRIAGKNEQQIYRLLDLPFIEPELREDHGEIEAAKLNKLPILISLSDIRGDLHCHTKATDGINTLEEMIASAVEHGYEYIAITDHSKRLAMVRGLDKKRLFEQIKMIEKIQNKFPLITILKGLEVDILENGKLDLSNDVLKELDLTVCSIHYKFNLNSEQQTNRILRAMDNPYFNILGHPTGRLINKRVPYELQVEKIMKAAKEKNCYLEVNAQPDRLDLNDNYCRMAREFGVKLAISTDAHSTGQLNYMEYGVAQARRGWIEAKDVINTYPLEKLKLLLKRK